METLSNLSLVLGSSWASGLNLYLTIAVLGIAHRVELITLPGNLDAISSPPVIIIAILLYLVEFLADKIPYVDSAWDSVHTIIRPVGGAAMAYMATADAPAAAQVSAALLCGAVTLESHTAKATTRAAINTSPEPITNSIASVTEDGIVAVLMYLIVKHPIIALVATIGLLVFSVWLIKILFRFIRKVFKFFIRDKSDKPV